MQHRSGVTGGGGGAGAETPPPETFHREMFADVSGKKRQVKKGKGVKIEKKRRKVGKGKREGGKKMEIEVGKVIKRGEDLFFFFFFFFFSSSSSSSFHFWKRRKFVLGLPKWEFSTGKKTFHAWKKIRKNYFPHSGKYACYAPAAPDSRQFHFPNNYIKRMPLNFSEIWWW